MHPLPLHSARVDRRARARRLSGRLSATALALLAACGTAVPTTPEPPTDAQAPDGLDGGGGGGQPLDAAAPLDADARPEPTRGALTITSAGALRTSEDGARATFTVALDSAPSAPVEVAVTSATPGEVRVEPAVLRFTPETWAVPVTVTLVGQDDDMADGDQIVAIDLGPAVSDDPRFSGARAESLRVTNADDDTPGVDVSTPSNAGRTNEGGGAVTFSVRLRSRPTGDVAVEVASTAPSEGVPDTARLSFSAATWNLPQTVTVTGQDDAIADGDRAYAIRLGPVTSGDARYAGLSATDVALVNQDDDAPGLLVSEPAPAFTTEAGGASAFTVRLRSQPSADVTVSIGSSVPSEGAPDVESLVFTPANYATPQPVVVTGRDDSIDDGDRAYRIVVGPLAGADPLYTALASVEVPLTNRDDDTAGIVIGAPQPGASTSEAGGSATFTVTLTSQPTSDVTLTISSSDATEGTVAPGAVVITPAEWNVPHTVTVTGMDDALFDGAQTYSVVFAPSASADALYAGRTPAPLAFVNADDDLPCAGGATAQSFGGGVWGCAGTVTHAARATLCNAAAGCVPAGLATWDAVRGNQAPASNYWVNENYGHGGNDEACWAGPEGQGGIASCGAATPMRLCVAPVAGDPRCGGDRYCGIDAQGNRCNWTRCRSSQNGAANHLGGCIGNPHRRNAVHLPMNARSLSPTLPRYPDFATFVHAEVLSRLRADPSAPRLDGRARGGNPAPVATFDHRGATWRVHADSHVSRALAAYAAMLDGRDGLVEETAVRSGARRLVVDPSLLPTGAPARFYVYEDRGAPAPPRNGRSRRTEPSSP